MLKYTWSIFFLNMVFYGYTQPCDTSKGFQTMYSFKNVDNFGNKDIYGIINIIEDQTGNIVTWGNIQFFNGVGIYTVNKMISKTTPKGTLLWAKRFEDNNDNNFTSKISLTKDNGYLVVCRGSALVKLTPDGAVEWASNFSFNDSKLNEGTGTRIIQLTNGNFITVGGTSNISGSNTYGFITCTDTAGILLWNKYFDDAAFSKSKYYGGSGALTKVIELRDGNLLLCGAHSYRVDSLQLQVGPRFYLQKMNASTGTVIWSSFLVPKDSIGAFSGSSIEIHELSDRSIHFHVNRRSNTLQGYAGPSSNSYYHINAAGSFIEGKTIQLNSPADTLASYYAGTDKQGNDVFYGEVTGITPYHILFKESNNIVKWAKSYHSSLSIGSLNRITTATVGSNSNIIGGNFITRNFSGNTGNDEYQNYLIKTDTLGNTNCSDTFSIPLVITKADTVIQYPATWDNQQGIISTPVNIVNEDLLPYDMRDCLIKTRCCNDTIKYTNSVICNSAAYTLPDNATVTQPGIYSSYFQTPKGCDSIIFTILTQEGIPSIQLGNDTCLIGSSEIILNPKTTNAAVSSFLWQDGSRDSSYTIKKPGLYWVRDSTACGTVSDSIMVYSDCNLPIYIPNAFTPNGDYLNDVFKIGDMRNQQLIDFSIYNRYGQVVFKTTDPKKGWDGKINSKDQPISTFVYLIRYKDFTGKLQFAKGTFMLLR